MNSKSKNYIHADEQDDSRLEKTRLGDFKSFQYLLSQTGKYKWYFIVAILLMLFSSISYMSSAWFIGRLVQDGLLAKNLNDGIIFSGLVLACQIVGITLTWLGRTLLARGGSLSILKIRDVLFKHLHKLPLKYYDRTPQGRIVTRITHDVEGVENFFVSSLGRLVMSLFMTVVSMAAMILTDMRIGIFLILSMLPSILFVFITRNKARIVNRNISRCSSTLNSRLSEYLSGMEVIRGFGLEGWSKEKYNKSVDDLLDASLNANLFMSITRPFIAFLCGVPLVVLIWFGGVGIISGAITIGIFVSFVRYCERFINPIMSLAREFHVIQEAFTQAERIVAFLKEHDEQEVLGKDGEINALNSPKISGAIRFKNVSMSYLDDEWALKDISFRIRPGEKVGLVGTTGCGKTTTVSLLSRLYEFQKGDIFIDDRSIKEYSRDYLRSLIGFVSQDVVIFKGSLRENLTTAETIDDKEIRYAADETGLTKAMEKTSLTLDSPILDGGANLSVGERQLLALTRIILRRPSVLVLDEATANIDPDYEKIIHQAVDKIMKGRTCIIIAHRLDTLQSCDRILVFEHGRIVEKGTSAELMDRKGYFYQLHQASGIDEKSYLY